jgi:hypothetical protein
VSIDDPGWGGEDFSGGGGRGSGGSGGGWGPAGGKPPVDRPSWLTVPYLAGGAAVLVVIVVVVAVVATRGGSAKPTAKVVVSKTPTTAVSTATRSSSPTPSPSPTGETITQYDRLADAVCTKDQPAITAAGTNLENQYKAQVDEFGDLEELTSPAEESDEQEDWIKQQSDALMDLSKGDESGYKNELMSAYTTAAKLGMTICNQDY